MMLFWLAPRDHSPGHMHGVTGDGCAHHAQPFGQLHSFHPPPPIDPHKKPPQLTIWATRKQPANGHLIMFSQSELTFHSHSLAEYERRQRIWSIDSTISAVEACCPSGFASPPSSLHSQLTALTVILATELFPVSPCTALPSAVEACCPSGFGWGDSDRPSIETCCASSSSVEEVEGDGDGLRMWNLRRWSAAASCIPAFLFTLYCVRRSSPGCCKAVRRTKQQ